MAAARKYWKNEMWQNDKLYHFSNIFGAKESNENYIFKIWGQGHLLGHLKGQHPEKTANSGVKFQ